MTVDFSAWAVPPLPLALGGRTYVVHPPSVEAARILLACAVRAEVNLGLVKGPISADIQAVLDTIKPGDHPALGTEVYGQMVADGIHPESIDRMAYYAVLYWARGKNYADIIARLLWTPSEAEATADKVDDDLAGKVAPTSPRSSGRGSGSATRSTKTKTASRSSRTTGSRSS